MIKTIIALAIFNIFAWIPFGHPEELNSVFIVGRGFVAIATIATLVLGALSHIKATTRKCPKCGNYNDKTDTTCTSCKQSLN